jgi:hypothetical protein
MSFHKKHRQPDAEYEHNNHIILEGNSNKVA